MELHYTKAGNGPVLFIVHGLYGSGDNWMNIAKALEDHFTVYLVDQRNHGKSPHSAIHDYNAMAADLKNICNRENITSLYIIGHSMGGKTAITFTLNYPGLVQKLINVDISPYSYLDQEHFNDQIKFHKLIIDTFKNAPLTQIRSRAEMENYFESRVPNPSICKFLLKNLKRSKQKNFYWQINIDALERNLTTIVDAAPPVKIGAQSFIPVMFVRGGTSPYISDDEMDAIPDVFPNAEFKTFENSGHWLHAEEPERFISAAKNFLSD